MVGQEEGRTGEGVVLIPGCMNWRRWTQLVVVVFVTCFAGMFFGCKNATIEQSKTLNNDYTDQRRVAYENRQYGFSLLFPPSWKIATELIPHEQLKPGGDVLVHDHLLSSQTVSADQANTKSVLKLIPVHFWDRNIFEPSLSVTAEGIFDGGPITNAHDYIVHTGKLLTSLSSMKYLVIGAPTKIAVDAIDMYHAKYRVVSGGVTIQQSVYAVVINGKALLFVLCAGTDPQMVTLQTIFNSLRFTIPTDSDKRIEKQ
jgi:hypothetical protein